MAKPTAGPRGRSYSGATSRLSVAAIEQRAERTLMKNFTLASWYNRHLRPKVAIPCPMASFLENDERSI